MNISEYCIRHPITTALLAVGIAAFGVAGYLSLPVSDLPSIDFPTISVTATLPGASPEVMASTVATPLEREFAAIQGISSINSTSTLGNTRITLQFNLDRDVDTGAQDVQSAIQAATRFLPDTLPQLPTYRKVNPAEQPIIYLSLSSANRLIYEVDEFAQRTVADRLTSVRGVAQVDIFGSQRYAVRVQLDPNKLASQGIGVDEVQQALQQGNSNLPAGVLYGRDKAYTLETTGRLTSAEDYRPLIVTYRNGNPVRLDQIARVYDGVENDKSAGWFKTQRGVILAVQRQPGTNTVEIVDQIRELLPSVRERIPPDVDLDVLNDRSQPIRASIRDVQITLLITILLVVLVIFAFLRSLRATLIPSVTLPFSYLACFGVMALAGFSLNNLSALALTLAIGFVVDDAIVVLENTVRLREEGKPRMEAAIEAARQLTPTVISMSLSLVAIFIPVLFLGGLVGRLLREFAIVSSVATLVSSTIALTLIPTLCSRYLRVEKKDKESEQKRNWWYRTSEKVFQGLEKRYEGSLQWAFGHRILIVLVTAGLTAGSMYLLLKMPKGFIPAEDRGLIVASTEASQDISFEDMVRHQQQLAEIISKNPHVGSYSSSVGGGPVGAGNTGRIFIRLKPGDRPHAREILATLRPQLAQVPGILAFMTIPPTVRIGGQITKSQYQFTLQDPDTQSLYDWTPKVEARLRTLAGLQDVTSDLQVASPQITVDIDRDKATTLGITAAAVENTLYSAYGQRQVSTIYTDNNQYYVILELLPEFQRDPAALSRLYVRGANNQLVPLDTIARFRPSVGPITVSRYAQLPSTTVSFALSPGTSLSQAIERIQAATREISLPSTTITTFQGEAQEFQESFSNIGVLFLLTVLVIYIVLGIFYESFFHPLTILAGMLPSALGALLILQVFGMDLDLYGFVGLLLLIGIAVKNAIIIVDVALEQQAGGKDAEEAVLRGSILRFRPILMTTAAAFIGALPTAIGFGAGGDVRRPLGLTTVGGLLVSQLVTLYFTPVVFLYLQRAQERISDWRKRHQKPEDKEEEEAEQQPAQQPEPEEEPSAV